MAKSFSVTVTPSEIENFEDILHKIGGFGKFQLLILVLLLSLEIPAAFLVFSPIFFGAKPLQWLCDNNTINSGDVCNCNGTLSTTFSSIVAEWELICDAEWVSDFITSVQMLGMFIGNLYGGQISDWYGRKSAYLGTTALTVLGTAVSASAPNAYVFAFSRLVCGAGFSGFLSVTLIYSMEFMTPKWRLLSSSVGPFGEGIMLLGVLAYFIRSWRNLLWATLVPFSLLIVILPIIPESPRWLLRNQKIEQGQKVLNLIARINGTEEIDCTVLKSIAAKEKTGTSDKIKKMSYLEFFKEKSVRRTSLCLMTIWSAWAVMYFGIAYNIKNVGGSPYLNVILMGLSDAIAYPVSFFVNNRIGRRRALSIFMTMTAFFLVSLAILYLVFDLSEYPYVVVSLCLLGKLTAAGARSSLRTLTGESYPTSMRNMSMGLVGMAACVTALFAPQLAYLGSRWPSVPFFTFAVFSVSAALMSFMLTETKGKPLQNEVNTTKKSVIVTEIQTDEANPDTLRRISIHTIVPSKQNNSC